MTLLVRVVAPHFVAGVLYDEGADRVAEAAPILSYAVGWNRARLRTYVERKGWRASIVPDAVMCDRPAPTGRAMA